MENERRGESAEKAKIMKMNISRTNKLILSAAAVALGLTFGGQLRANDSLLPPRAQALTPKVVARDTQNEPDLVRSQPMGIAAKIAAQRPPAVRAQNSKTEPKSNRGPLYTGKTPFRKTGPAQFEIAPVK